MRTGPFPGRTGPSFPRSTPETAGGATDNRTDGHPYAFCTTREKRRHSPWLRGARESSFSDASSNHAGTGMSCWVWSSSNRAASAIPGRSIGSVISSCLVFRGIHILPWPRPPHQSGDMVRVTFRPQRWNVTPSRSGHCERTLAAQAALATFDLAGNRASTREIGTRAVSGMSRIGTSAIAAAIIR